MSDAFRRLGQRAAQIAPTRTGDLGSALAQVLAPQAAPSPTYRPSVTPSSYVPPRPAQQAGQAAARQAAPWVQEAIAPAITLANNLMQQQQDEPWVEVENEDGDFLFMPRSYANNPPVGWTLVGEVDERDRDFVESDANAYNIFQQPPDVQASWGIAMPGGQMGYADPKDAAPMDTSIIRGPQAVVDPIAQATGQAVGQFGGDARRAESEAQDRLNRMIEALGMGGTQPAFDYTGQMDVLREQAAPGYVAPEQTSWLDSVLDSTVSIGGNDISLRDVPDLITTGSGLPGGGAPEGDAGPALPGTSIPASRAAEQVKDVAEDVRNAPVGDLINLPSTGTLAGLFTELNDLRDGGWKDPGEWSDVIGSIFGAGAESSPLVDILFGAAEAPSEWWKSAQSSSILNGEIDLGLARPPFDQTAFASRLIHREDLLLAVPVGHRLTRLGRARKRAVIIAFDAAVMLLALWLSFCIRLGELYTPANRWVVPLALGAVILGRAGGGLGQHGAAAGKVAAQLQRRLDPAIRINKIGAAVANVSDCDLLTQHQRRG